MGGNTIIGPLLPFTTTVRLFQNFFTSPTPRSHTTRGCTNLSRSVSNRFFAIPIRELVSFKQASTTIRDGLPSRGCVVDRHLDIVEELARSLVRTTVSPVVAFRCGAGSRLLSELLDFSCSDVSEARAANIDLNSRLFICSAIRPKANLIGLDNRDT